MEIEIPKQPATPPETKRMQDALLLRRELGTQVRGRLPGEKIWEERLRLVETLGLNWNAAYFAIRGRCDYSGGVIIEAWVDVCKLVAKLEREALDKMRTKAITTEARRHRVHGK